MKPEIKLLGNLVRGIHPFGCRQEVKNQIDYVKRQGHFEGPKKVLIIGGSSSYGLASRIVLAFGAKADTICVSMERGVKDEKNLGTAGWYNNIFFKEFAEKENLIAKNFIGDAFTDEVKQEVIDYIKKEFGGKIDLLVYSIAAPKRKDPKTGEEYVSALKTIGEEVTGWNINLEKEILFKQTVTPATPEEIFATEKVMGGEDWELWIDSLAEANVLATGFKTTLFSYIGPEITHPFYHHGTLGKAKEHATRSAQKIHQKISALVQGECRICVSKLVTTKASVVIPIVPFYAIALYKVMQSKGIHETPIQHKYRFFKEMMYGKNPELDSEGRYRPDNWELREDVQKETKELMSKINEDNFKTDLTAYHVFREEFLQINGFCVENMSYDQDYSLEDFTKLQP